MSQVRAQKYRPETQTGRPHAPDLATHRRRVLLSLLAVYFIWGSAYLGIRIAIQDIPPFLMAGSRFALAGELLYLWLRARGTPAPTRREWIATIKVAFLLVVVANGALVFAQQFVDSGIAAIVAATAALWTALFQGIWERWPSRPEWIGLLTGFAGVILLNANAGLQAHPAATAALMLSSVSWALGSIWGRHLALPKGAMASATQLLAGGIVLSALGLVVGERVAVPGMQSALAWLYLAIFSSLLGYSAYTYLIHNTRPALALSYEYLNPAIAVALGAVFEGERINGREIAAMLVVVGSVYFLMQGRGGQRRSAVRIRGEPSGV